jgi:hypothetical protein
MTVISPLGIRWFVGGGYIISIMELEQDKIRREFGHYINWTHHNLH